MLPLRFCSTCPCRHNRNVVRIHKSQTQCHTVSQCPMDKLTYTVTHTYTLSRSHSRSRCKTVSNARAHTHTYTQIRNTTGTHIHTHTHSHTHIHSYIHTHTYKYATPPILTLYHHTHAHHPITHTRSHCICPLQAHPVRRVLLDTHLRFQLSAKHGFIRVLQAARGEPTYASTHTSRHKHPDTNIQCGFSVTVKE